MAIDDLIRACETHIAEGSLVALRVSGEPPKHSRIRLGRRKGAPLGEVACHNDEEKYTVAYFDPHQVIKYMKKLYDLGD